jgi:hypothetical protein
MLIIQRETEKVDIIITKILIYSYRLERAMTNNTSQSIKLKDEIVICKEIISAVDIHRKAMELVSV